MKNHNLIFAIALTAMFFLIPLLGDVGLGYAQNVGINSTGAVANASAFLDIGDGAVPAGGDTKGLLIPRVALTITTSNAPVGAGIATSLLVYNTATVNDVTPGYYYWDGSQWVRFVSGVSGGGVPIGTIVAYGGASAPSDWLICDGSAVSRVTYANLFAVLGITYGAGDGVTTFNVPDLQQRFPLGKATAGTGSTLGATGGAIDHTHTGQATLTHIPM